MKIKVFLIVLVAILIASGVFVSTRSNEPVAPAAFVGEEAVSEADDAPLIEVVAENLSIPWEVLFLPDGELLVTERTGRILLLKAGVELEIPEVKTGGEGGLLGAALHPDFVTNNFIYIYHTLDTDEGTRNRVSRYRIENSELTLDRVILSNLPGARYHDGGRIMFGPDGYLYVTIGDALKASEAQNLNSLEGTLLRVTAEGEPAPGNPFGSMVYSYGHRNAQGLAWDESGNLWSTEHGRSGVRSGFDELNLIVLGGNYGWPDSEGDTVLADTVAPARHSTAAVTWAPGGLAYHEGSLYIPGLKSETLYEAVLEGTEIVAWHKHFVGAYGRLRTVQVGPDGLLYLTTSNRDGRGNPSDRDDRIIRINLGKLDR